MAIFGLKYRPGTARSTLLAFQGDREMHVKALILLPTVRGRAGPPDPPRTRTGAPGTSRPTGGLPPFYYVSAAAIPRGATHFRNGSNLGQCARKPERSSFRSIEAKRVAVSETA
jgi:hypothetical protein